MSIWPSVRSTDLHADTTHLSVCSEPFHMSCQFHVLSIQSSHTIWCHYCANLGHIFISCTNHTQLILKSFFSVHHVVTNTIFHCWFNLFEKKLHLGQLLKQTVWQAVVTHFSMSDTSTLTRHSFFQLVSQTVQSTLANFTLITFTGNAVISIWLNGGNL